MMTKAELAFSALDRDNKDNLVNINISTPRIKCIGVLLRKFCVKVYGICYKILQGYITQKDFKKLTKKLSEKELMELMAKVSLNV